MNKYIPTKAQWQGLFSKKPQLADLERLKHTKESFLSLVSGCNKTQLSIINFLIKHHLKYEVVTFGQKQIGDSLGLKRETINRNCQLLKTKGLLTANSGKKEYISNQYLVHNLFFEHAELLKASIPALRAYILKKNISKISKIVTPYKEDIYNILSNSMIIKGVKKGGDFLTCTRDVLIKSYKGFKKLLKQEEVKTMESEVKAIQVAPLVINNPIERISKVLSLNNWGKIRLMVYPEKALLFMFEQLGKQNGLKSPFYWLLAALDKYCFKNKLYVDWDLIPMLKKKYAIVDNPTYFEQKKSVRPKFVSFVTDVPKDDKIIVSELVGKHKDPHPDWKQFIPADLKLA